MQPNQEKVIQSTNSGDENEGGILDKEQLPQTTGQNMSKKEAESSNSIFTVVSDSVF